MLLRKCDNCGKILQSEDVTNEITIEVDGLMESLKVCNFCFNNILHESKNSNLLCEG